MYKLNGFAFDRIVTPDARFSIQKILLAGAVLLTGAVRNASVACIWQLRAEAYRASAPQELILLAMSSAFAADNDAEMRAGAEQDGCHRQIKE